MMGNPQEASEPSDRPQKATFSGATALIGVLALILSVVSVAVPHWGYYEPYGSGAFGGSASSSSYRSQGFSTQDNSGHYGPFQKCTYYQSHYLSYCRDTGVFKTTTWLIVGGVCAIVTVIAVALFSIFAILQVAMQLQRREIGCKYSTAVLMKLICAAVSVVSTLAAVILGGVDFAFSGRNNPWQISMGVCYYLQIVLIFVNILLVIMSFWSYRKAHKHPLHIVPKSRASNYEVPNGVSMTSSSGVPFQHGQPRTPNLRHQPPAQYQYYPEEFQQQQPPPQQPFQFNGAYASNNGFVPVSLSVPVDQPILQNLQPIRPIQPVQPVQPVQPQPRMAPQQHPQPVPQPVSAPAGPGVSFMPGGRGAGYSKMGPGHGSMESLDSTQSLTLSIGSYGSTTSTGSNSAVRRSIIKKKKKDADTMSETSSKRVRISLGSEQTAV